MLNGIKNDASPKVAVSEDSSLNENVFRGAGIQSDTIQYFFYPGSRNKYKISAGKNSR